MSNCSRSSDRWKCSFSMNKGSVALNFGIFIIPGADFFIIYMNVPPFFISSTMNELIFVGTR